MEHVFNIGMTYALLDAIHYLCKWFFAGTRSAGQGYRKHN